MLIASAAGLVYLVPQNEIAKRFYTSSRPQTEGGAGFLEKLNPFDKTDGSKPRDEKYDAAGRQSPPPQTKVVKDADDSEGTLSDTKPWSTFAASFPELSWSSIPDRLTDLILPDWLKLVPGFMTKLQNELSMAPGSLAEEIWDEAHNPEINPEITWSASVRVSDELCKEEQAFLKLRKLQTTKALARYLGVSAQEVHPDDVPIISMCGSGGGLRALVAGTSSYLSTKEAGLFDCVTYTAGVSGSCWLQALFYSSIGQQSHRQMINHLKHRLGVHIAYPPAALSLATYTPTSKYLLSGLVEKFKGVPDADFGLVDIYGLLLAARLLVPKGNLDVYGEDLKLSNQRRFIDDGQHPLPIYTAVRHEIPIEEQRETDQATARAKAKKEAWFQWFEFTPYEFWCEEIEAGIPTWAIGREFREGRSTFREDGLALPELRVPLFLGIWGSAMCATLSHYYKEVRPALRTLKGFAGLDALISERDDDLVKVHPIDPATIPNFARGMKHQLPSTCPESINNNTHLQLMDAGMSNNLPIYPLLRPGRNVDILVAFDGSADVKTDNWLKVVDGYARQRGIKGWPLGAGWPPVGSKTSEVVQDIDRAQASDPADAQQRIEKAKQNGESPDRSQDSPTDEKKAGALGYCNVWIGTTEERNYAGDETPTSKLVEEDWELSQDDAGICVIYFPLLANDKVPGVDPKTSDFLSTWNFVYTPEQVDKVVELARTNFREGEDQVKRTVRAVYERKKKLRLDREKLDKERRRAAKMRSGTRGKKLGEGDHANQFA